MEQDQEPDMYMLWMVPIILQQDISSAGVSHDLTTWWAGHRTPCAIAAALVHACWVGLHVKRSQCLFCCLCCQVELLLQDVAW